MSRISPTLPLTIYAAATGLLEPLAPSLLRRRARRGKELASRLAERLGRPTRPRPQGPLVWLHGVSVGESLSLLALISALQKSRPDLTILVTSGTVTSAEVLARRLPANVIHQFAPIDAPGATARFVEYWRPGVGLFVESELWPNLIAAARARGVRLGLLSARMTHASATGWAKVPASARSLLQSFELVLAQDAKTEARLMGLGAHVGGRLNLKLVGLAPPVEAKTLAKLRAGLDGRSALLAASTHPGEEVLIAKAFRGAMANCAPGVLILAPRHPERASQVALELQRLGFIVARRSLGEPLTGQTTIYIADTLGELGAFYLAAKLVVMGGSFVPGVGGHNPIEPARLKAAIVTGPHVDNAQEIYAEMLAEGAVVQAEDAADLQRRMHELMTDPKSARRLASAAQAFAGRQSAALEGAMIILAPLLPQ